jgi:ribonuclease HI
MQRSLGNFAGFTIQKKTPGLFNPFENEPAASEDSLSSLSASLKAKKPVEVTNILDAPPSSTITSLPQRKEEPVVNLFPTGPRAVVGPVANTVAIQSVQEKTVIEETTFVEMIQPRAKDGSRLLYKYPHCPKVGVKGCFTLLVGESDRSETAWLIQFDGAANPNPGPASSGAVLWSPKDLDGRRNPVFESGKYLGKATNNIAEVQGLLLGLQIAATRGARELLIEGDSELIIFQQTGRYRVSDAKLKRWWAEIQVAMMDETAFDWIAIRQVPREQNERADSITKEVLSRKASFQRA